MGIQLQALLNQMKHKSDESSLMDAEGTRNEMDGFDQVKSYSNYFVNSNIEGILKRFAPSIEYQPTVSSHKGTKKVHTRSLLAGTL